MILKNTWRCTVEYLDDDDNNKKMGNVIMLPMTGHKPSCMLDESEKMRVMLLCFDIFASLFFFFNLVYACMCVVYRSKSANNETIRHWSPTFSQGRKIKLFCCFILSYHTFLPSSLQRTYVYCVRWKKGVSHNFCPGQLVSLFWSLCFEEKNVSFCFCFCCNCLRWVETSSYFLLRICSRFFVAFYIFLCFFEPKTNRV
jgi:hypothetical protein